MSEMPSTRSAELDGAAMETVTAGGDTLLGMATLGKTAAVLALIIALILLCSYLVRRLGPQRHFQNSRLRVVGATAVGSRERVVIVEIKDTWLVLGVGGGQVNKLHEMTAPDEADMASSASFQPQGSSFASRFAQALKHNASQTLGKGRRPPRGES